jgi:hypothetical protein
MKRLIAFLILPAILSVAPLGGAAVVGVSSAGAAEQGHAVMMTKTWHGKVSKIDETMGTTESFTMVDHMKKYVVHYDAMTKFEMGTKKNIKVGALVTVTGTLTHTTISATKLSV